MRGLLLRKRASLETDESPAGLEYLLRAEQALRESYEERCALEDPDTSLALDRSRYNLAGLEVRLAQRDKPANAADHLREAYTHYDEVLAARRRRYRTDDLEDVVACVNGLAIVDYCQAYLLTGTWRSKTALLRAAHRRAGEAVDIRERLAGTTDDVNISKSLALQAKITLARLAVIEAAGKRGDRAETAIDGYRKEIGQLLDQHETEGE